MKIYLAGNVPKSKDEEKGYINWRIKYQQELEKNLDCECIDPSALHLNEADLMLVFSAACKNINNCDLMIVNAEQQLGVGTSQEMVIAKYLKKPVITVLPKDSFHRKTDNEINGKIIADWIHPFIFAFSDLIIEKIEDIDLSKIKKVKDISIIDSFLKS